MKSIRFIALPLCVLLASTASFAGEEICDNDDIHCAYSEAHPSNSYIFQGRYVRMLVNSSHYQNLSVVECLTPSSAISISSDMADTVTPNETITWQFEQCSNMSCTKTQPIGTDSFVINNNKTSSTPNRFKINIDFNFGDACLVFDAKFRMKK